MKIAFIGTGVMGEAMISALLRHGIMAPDAIRAYDINPNRLAVIEKRYSISTTSSVDSALSEYDVIVLAIKPQSLAGVFEAVRGLLREGQVVLSVVAGAKISAIRKGLVHDSVVRVMPNAPAQFGEGMSVWIASNTVSQAHKEVVQTILESMGKQILVSDEKYIDMATAISGSGPAYIFLIMESLIDAAVHIGLPRDLASELVLQTITGAAHMTRESGKHPAELKNLVTSPGGTTAAALLSLEEGRIRAILTQAIIAAYEKAQLLGGEKSK